MLDTLSDVEYKRQLNTIEPLNELLKKHVPDISAEDKPFFKEVVLWALTEYKKLSKYNLGDGIQFKDVYGGYISGL